MCRRGTIEWQRNENEYKEKRHESSGENKLKSIAEIVNGIVRLASKHVQTKKKWMQSKDCVDKAEERETKTETQNREKMA